MLVLLSAARLCPTKLLVSLWGREQGRKAREGLDCWWRGQETHVRRWHRSTGSNRAIF